MHNLADAQHLYQQAKDELHLQADLQATDLQQTPQVHAVTALLLWIYEIMNAHYLQLRSPEWQNLIRGCSWNARSAPAAATCFWYHVTAEVLQSVTEESSISWNPTDWGYSLDYPSLQSTAKPCTSEEWIHAIIYILARIVRFETQPFSGWEHLVWWQGCIPQDLKPLVKNFTPVTPLVPRYW